MIAEMYKSLLNIFNVDDGGGDCEIDENGHGQVYYPSGKSDIHYWITLDKNCWSLHAEMIFLPEDDIWEGFNLVEEGCDIYEMDKDFCHLWEVIKCVEEMEERSEYKPTGRKENTMKEEMKKAFIEALAEKFHLHPEEDGEFDMDSYDWTSGCSCNGEWFSLGAVVDVLDGVLDDYCWD